MALQNGIQSRCCWERLESLGRTMDQATAFTSSPREPNQRPRIKLGLNSPKDADPSGWQPAPRGEGTSFQPGGMTAWHSYLPWQSRGSPPAPGDADFLLPHCRTNFRPVTTRYSKHPLNKTRHPALPPRRLDSAQLPSTHHTSAPRCSC